MDNDMYIEIIKKQNELIDLLNKALYDSSNAQIYAPRNGQNTEETVITPSSPVDLYGFDQWMRRKGLSQNSIDTYKTQVALFYRDFGDMTTETLDAYERTFETLSDKTSNVKIAAMNKYFKFTGYCEYEFKKVKEQKRTFCNNAINEEQYKLLMEWAVENNRKVWLICKVISCTGVRVSELIKLKTSYLDNGYADITGKGNKVRRIYFCKSLIEEIRDECGKEYIVENLHGKQITTRGVSQLLLKAGEKAGIPKEVMHPHSFRHFFAKQFLKKSNDLSLLGDLLGHSNLTTTAIYTRMTSDEQRNAIDSLINW